VFVIAEAGVNHDGKLGQALQLVDAAAEAGADAVKFQLFRVEEQISGVAPTADYQQKHTGATTMTEMAKSYDLAWEAHREIAAHCRMRGIVYMASCFDPQAVDFYLGLGGLAIKVGSGEITNLPLLGHMARTGRPVLLSTGMSTLEEVAAAVDHLRRGGDGPLALFHCTSNYPTAPAAVNLRVIQTLAQAFGVPVGFSDHTSGSAVASAAVALGACMIEKHFTIDRGLPGPDHAMSLDPGELRQFVTSVREAEAALGSGIKYLQPGEAEVQRVARRSLVSTRLIRAGERLDESSIALKRPATGIAPHLLASVCGRIAAVDIPADVPIVWEMLA
jgi:N-acetylneuraminate synthase/N,N'-diacetyllegionaminate synthase